MRVFAAFIVLALIGSSAMAGLVTERNKIDYLLGQLTASDITFIRNGEEHTAAWGKEHLEEKFKQANRPDMTAEDFIVNIASVSSHTGKPYLIRTKNGKVIKASEWFKEKLENMPIA